MSLVAYASSDESDSEVEPLDNRQAPSSETELTVASVCSNNNGESESSTTHQNDHISDSDSDREQTAEDGGIDEKLRALPQPKSGPGNSLEENDVLEENVKPKTSQIKDAPKPPSKKVRQPVKFTIAAISENSDDDEPASKKTKTSNSIQGKSGLFSMLPPPVHAAKKEANRILLPHSLKKTTSQTAKQVTNTASFSQSKAKPAKQKLQGLSGYGSDSDEEAPASFFSLDSNEKSDEIVFPEPPPDLRKNKLSLPPPTKMDVSESPVLESVATKQSSSSSDSKNNVQSDVSDSVQSTNIETDNNQQVPVTEPVFSSSENLPLNDEPLKFNSQHMGFASQFSYFHTSHNRSGNNQSMYSDYGPVYQNQPDEELPEVSAASTVEGLDIPEQELLRLQGKRKKGKEEIHFVDVNADDYTDPTEIHKHLSEEQTHQSHRKKDGPTSTQKRKHQITYLAHQAKERELELKNQWSQNRMTRKQTQAKYGF